MGERKKPRGRSSTGTARLFVAFGAGLAGVVYLVLVIVPVVRGHVEFAATATDIDTIELEGFPDAAYLTVEGGNLVFSRAHVWLSKRDGKRSLFQLTAPVVSRRQLEELAGSRDSREPLDLSGLRLVAVLKGDEVRERWPDVARRAEAEEPLDVEPVMTTLTGDTLVAKGQLGLPTFPDANAVGLDWSKARRLSNGVHHDSPGRVAWHLILSLVLLAVSFFTFRHHIRNPTRSPPGGLDLTPLVDGTLDL